MRFSQGDYVVHRGQGVCKVIDIRKKQTIIGAAPDCPGRQKTISEYVLNPVSDKKLRIHHPVGMESSLRSVVEPEQARKLLSGLADMDCDSFDTPQAWNVRDHYMGALREGDTGDAMRVAKTAHMHIEEALHEGKKPRQCYATIFKEARQRLLDELCVSLDEPREEIDSLLDKGFAD